MDHAWSRPDSSDFPKIWLRQGGFVVRDVTADMDDYIIEHMVNNYAEDTPTYASLGISKNAASIAEITFNWKRELTKRVSLVVLAEGTPGADLLPVDHANPPKVLGANIMMVTSSTDKLVSINEIAKDIRVKRLYTAKRNFTDTINVFDRYKVRCILDTNGLSVDQTERGQGLGRMLLEARLEMCRGLGIPLTKSIFVSVGSQYIAAKVGFTVIKEIAYPDFLDSDGVKFFPDLYHTLQYSVYKL